MKKNIFTLIFMLVSGTVCAEPLASYNFWGAPNTSPETAPGGTTYTGVSAVNMSRGPGLTAGTPTNNWVAANWLGSDTLGNALAGDNYLQGSIASAGGLIAITNIQFRIRLSSITAAPTSYVIRVSTDAGFGTYTDSAQVNYNSAGISTLSFDLTGSASGSNVYYRIYGFGAGIINNAANTGFAGGNNPSPTADAGISGFGDNLQDFVIQGSVSAVLIPRYLRLIVFEKK